MGSPVLPSLTSGEVLHSTMSAGSDQEAGGGALGTFQRGPCPREAALGKSAEFPSCLFCRDLLLSGPRDGK